MKKIFIQINVIVFCIFFYTNSITAQTAVIWKDATSKIVVNGNTIQKLNGGSGSWAHGAASTQTIGAGKDGYCEITISENDSKRAFGLSTLPNQSGERDEIDYCIQLHINGELRILTEGTFLTNGGSQTWTNYSNGDILRVERSGTNILFKKNGTTIHSLSNATAAEIFLDASIKDNTASISNAMLFEDNDGVCNTTVYADTDGDGFGNPNNTSINCSNPLPSGWVANSDDCDDTNNAIHPNTVWYADTDGDSFGNPAVSQTQCEQPSGFVLNNTDCDDTTNDPSNNCGGGSTVWTQSGNDIRYSDGKVWIGDDALDIASTDYNLFVEKGIMTERLKVAIEGSGDWADYVFADDYTRIKIDELEKFIKENKHLPNVPSAEEVVTNGIDVAKMDATLLQQIEELWLYIIDMKKENEELKKSIANLEK